MIRIIIAAACLFAGGFSAGLNMHHQDAQPIYIGGPGGGFYGGKVIVNVPPGTSVIETTIGCPGGAGKPGGNATKDFTVFQ